MNFKNQFCTKNEIVFEIFLAMYFLTSFLENIVFFLYFGELLKQVGVDPISRNMCLIVMHTCNVDILNLSI